MSVSHRLLAKSVRLGELSDNVPSTLLGHLQSVQAAAEIIVAETRPDQLGAVGLSNDEWLERLRRVVLLSAALHDLGKANHHFQRMVHGYSRQRQGLRHEWVTYWLCQQKPWSNWGPLAAGSEDDWRIVLWAIAGHHPAMRRP
jgi:CRISPR-associated endonuclease/helicase Cas3